MPMVLCVSDIIEEEVTPKTLGIVSTTLIWKYFEYYIGYYYIGFINWEFLLGKTDIKENVCKIIYSLELTDMWYKIRADVDLPLQRAISKSKIQIGYKLEICGAKVTVSE